VTARGSGAAVAASFLGWTLDAFDFFLVVISVPAIAAEFHQPIKAVALSLTLTLLFRPLGAAIFGLMAERYGRRLPLMIDLVFFSIIEIATGFAPTFTAFLVLRALFGIGMGGEWGVGSALAMEKAPSARRGIVSGLLQEGYATGYLLAAVCSFFVLPRWGWRPMFYIGGLPALLAIFVRFRVTESEVWERTRHASWGSLFDGVLSQWRLFLGLVLLMTMMNLVSHGTQDLYPTFLQKQHNFDPGTVSWIVIVANLGAIAGGLIFGHVSEKIGRVNAITVAALIALPALPLWAFASTPILLAVGAFIMQVAVQGAWGVIPAHLNELSPGAARATIPAFVYQAGNFLASYNGPFQAQIAQANGGNYGFALALIAGVVAIAIVVVIRFSPERRGELLKAH
jgi:SHS family lactate transporter-like MFS transporter